MKAMIDTLGDSIALVLEDPSALAAKYIGCLDIF